MVTVIKKYGIPFWIFFVLIEISFFMALFFGYFNNFSPVPIPDKAFYDEINIYDPTPDYSRWSFFSMMLLFFFFYVATFFDKRLDKRRTKIVLFWGFNFFFAVIFLMLFSGKGL